MNKFDPRVKLFAVISTTTMALFFQNVPMLLTLCLISFLLCTIFKGDYKTFYNRLRRFVPVFIMVSLVQIFFVRTGEAIVVWGDYTLVTSGGLVRGINMLLRFIIIFISAAIMAGENSRRVVASLSKLKIPYIFSFMIMTTLRFIPVYGESFSDAMTALQLRGIEIKEIALGKKIKVYGHLFLPVVADSVVKARELSITMEARGFGAKKTRTNYIQLELSKVDYLFFGLIFFGCIALLVLNFKLF